tara:strand:+ start:483 stop:725 length:243 start_codon:yes stop_codon:yes gene_type:complete
MGFHKIAPYYYTGWHEPGSELQFLVNKLSEDLQEIFRVAMRTAAYDMYTQATHESGKNWACGLSFHWVIFNVNSQLKASL